MSCVHCFHPFTPLFSVNQPQHGSAVVIHRFIFFQGVAPPATSMYPGGGAPGYPTGHVPPPGAAVCPPAPGYAPPPGVGYPQPAPPPGGAYPPGHLPPQGAYPGGQQPGQGRVGRNLLHPPRNYYFHDCLFVCLIAGLYNCYSLDLPEKKIEDGS